MNKKGFTLIEMIAVFTLLGVIGISMTFGMKGIINKNKEKEKSDLLSKWKSACNTCKSTNDTCSANNMYNEGLITKDVYNMYKNQTC